MAISHFMEPTVTTSETINLTGGGLGFGQRLADCVERKNNAVCVGLDPRMGSLPEPFAAARTMPLEKQALAFEQFCCEIIDCVQDLVPVVKPQAAFFEELGPHGMRALANVIRYATQQGLIVILDAKRGDIGATASAYANAHLGSGSEGSAAYSPWGADALTVNPFLGIDTLTPFVQRCDSSGAGIFVLAKTSNPGSGFLQEVPVPGVGDVSDAISNAIQSLAAQRTGAAGYGSVGAVVGATYPEKLEALRDRMPNAWLLIPGYGAQGGGAEDVVRGMDARGLGAIVNSSRGIIFAYEQPQYQVSKWTDAVRQATLDMIEALRNAHAARS